MVTLTLFDGTSNSPCEVSDAALVLDSKLTCIDYGSLLNDVRVHRSTFPIPLTVVNSAAFHLFVHLVQQLESAADVHISGFQRQRASSEDIGAFSRSCSSKKTSLGSRLLFQNLSLSCGPLGSTLWLVSDARPGKQTVFGGGDGSIATFSGAAKDCDSSIKAIFLLYSPNTPR